MRLCHCDGSCSAHSELQDSRDKNDDCLNRVGTSRNSYKRVCPWINTLGVCTNWNPEAAEWIWKQFISFPPGFSVAATSWLNGSDQFLCMSIEQTDDWLLSDSDWSIRSVWDTETEDHEDVEQEENEGEEKGRGRETQTKEKEEDDEEKEAGKGKKKTLLQRVTLSAEPGLSLINLDDGCRWTGRGNDLIINQSHQREAV